MLLAYPTTAQSPQHEYQTLAYLPDSLLNEDSPPIIQTRPTQPGGRHLIRAKGTITPEQLASFLGPSPLAPYSKEILRSPYWSTIIGICWIEQYHCQKAPGFNYWGIGPGKHYANIEEGIAAISQLLAQYDSKGYDTIEKLNGYYVQPASDNWLNTVITIKEKLESNEN